MRKLSKFRFDHNLSQQYFKTRKEYKKLIKHNHSGFRNKLLTKLHEVQENNPNEFWEVYNELCNMDKQNTNQHSPIKPENGLTIFKH